MQVLKLFFKFFHIIFNLLITTVVLLWLIYIEAYVQNFKIFDFQIFLHFVFVLMFVIILWWSLFKKIKLCIIFLIFSMAVFSVFLPSVIELLKFSSDYEDKNMDLSRIDKIFNSNCYPEDGDYKTERIIILNNEEIAL